MLDGLFDPRQAFAFKRAPTLERLFHRESLVVISHNGDVMRQALSHSAHRGEIARERRIAQAQFHRAKATLEQLLRLIREFLLRHQAQPIAVVSGNRLASAAQKFHQRLPRRDRQCVPARHIESRERQPHHSAHRNQPKMPRQLGAGLFSNMVSNMGGLDPFTLDSAQGLCEHARNQRRTDRHVTEKVRPAGNSLLCFEVDQQQGRRAHRLGARPQSQRHGHRDSPASDGVYRQDRRHSI